MNKNSFELFIRMYLAEKRRLKKEMYAAFHRLWTVTSLRSHQTILAMCRLPVWPTSRQNLEII